MVDYRPFLVKRIICDIWGVGGTLIRSPLLFARSAWNHLLKVQLFANSRLTPLVFITSKPPSDTDEHFVVRHYV